MNDTAKTLLVKPRGEEFEVLPPEHRRGLFRFPTELAAIGHAAARAPQVLVLNRTGKVKREVLTFDADACAANWWEG